MPPSASHAAPRHSLTAWIVFDAAIHGYTLMIPGVAFAIYFTSIVAIDSGAADPLWSLAVASSLVVAGLLAPWIGALADTSGRRRTLLVVATLACSGATAMLYTLGRGDIAAGIAYFVVAQVGATVAASLYNAFLPQVAGQRSVARVSGLAWGLSFLGGIGCFLLCLPFTRAGLAPSNLPMFALSFLVTSAFVLVLGLPAIAALPRAVRTPGAAAGRPYRRIWETVRHWRRDREVPKFLLAYYLVNDAVVTIIFFTAVMLKKSFGLDVQQVLLLSLGLQLIAVPATMAFGWLGARWSQRAAINVTLVLWLGVLTLMLLAQGHAGAVAIAAGIGVLIGSTQSLFRSLFTAMVPAERAAEYFGFHALAGRGSSALGPLFFGAVSALTGSQRWAMASLAVFFIAGGLVLARVRIPQDAVATAPHARSG